MTAPRFYENVDNLRIVGDPIATARYAKCSGRVIWYFHSEYRDHYIFRAFRANDKPCALYSIVTKTERLVAVNLVDIKDELKMYLGVLTR